MNASASNSLLKFIEEPESNIYGIFITTNKKNILPTILSRCQIFDLNFNFKMEYQIEEIKTGLEFLNLIYIKKEDTLPFLKSKFFNLYQTRDQILNFFQTLIIVLDKEINQRYEVIDEKFSFYDIIRTSLQKIALEDLIFYLDKIIVFKDKLLKNPYLNLNLFMDRFIIEISRVVIK